MNKECEVVRDLLPLYADDACSVTSREIVEEHLSECPECSALLTRLRNSELEDGLKSEKGDVIEYALRRFRRRTAAMGALISGTYMVPVLICLVVNMALGPALNWIYVVLAALLVAASLIAVPFLVREDKAFWTLCAFTASLMVLLGVVCLYTRGDWFFVAASATLFGLAMVSLPFACRMRPVRHLLGGRKPLPVIVCADVALFVNMLTMIAARGRITLSALLFLALTAAGVALVANGLLRQNGKR